VRHGENEVSLQALHNCTFEQLVIPFLRALHFVTYLGIQGTAITFDLLSDLQIALDFCVLQLRNVVSPQPVQ
jgi:hypothetical protein